MAPKIEMPSYFYNVFHGSRAINLHEYRAKLPPTAFRFMQNTVLVGFPQRYKQHIRPRAKFPANGFKEHVEMCITLKTAEWVTRQ